MSAPATIRRREPAAASLDGMHPVVARVMACRGIRDPAELDPSLEHLLGPEMADVDAAVERLAAALRGGERILVVGDFDADGATSVALAVRALRAFGHGAVDYLVPNRFDYGYGLTPALVEVAAERRPGLILTVDNGVACHAGVAAAHSRGIDTIVTDHHLPGETLPPAVAVVDPTRADCPFPSKCLAGVGVVFYLLAALRRRLQGSGWFGDGEAPPTMAAWLDLVALGTVADVVPLDRNNRILVEQGLRRIRAGRGCPGIRALLAAARRDPATVAAGDLGYAVGPRLNAAGRLSDMGVGIDTLLADDAEDARARADRLEALNRERREIEASMREQADAELERLRTELGPEAELPAGVTLFDERWHQGVSGILAGRVREAIHRPTVVFADAGEGWLKGSARSIDGLHVRDVLARIDAQEPGLIERFGGHAMAAGLTIGAERLEGFRAAFACAVEASLGGAAAVREIATDGSLAAQELSLDTALALRDAGPWGAGFPEPTFDGEFVVESVRTVGQGHLKLSVAPAGSRASIEAIAFNPPADARVGEGERLHLVYRLEVNTFRGRSRPQLVVEHLLAPGE